MSSSKPLSVHSWAYPNIPSLGSRAWSLDTYICCDCPCQPRYTIPFRVRTGSCCNLTFPLLPPSTIPCPRKSQTFFHVVQFMSSSWPYWCYQKDSVCQGTWKPDVTIGDAPWRPLFYRPCPAVAEDETSQLVMRVTYLFPLSFLCCCEYTQEPQKL